MRRNILEMISTWRANIERQENLTEEDRELIVNVSPAYLEWRDEVLMQGLGEGLQRGLQEGRQEGRLEDQRLFVENLLKVRFSSIEEALESAIAPLLQLPSEEAVCLLLELSREELLARFGRSEK